MGSPTRPGARLAALASAFPENEVDAAATEEALLALFPEEDPAFIQRLVAGSGVERRHLVPTLAEILSPRGFDRRNAACIEASIELAARSSARALASAGIEPRDVDAVIDVSCTGIAIPALDVELVPRLGLRDDVRRIPVTESGCAGGALALGLAGELARGGARVLVSAVELCSLTLREAGRTRADLVAAVLFGDGAAAALVLPESAGGHGGAPGNGPLIEASGSHLIPGSRDAMGFTVGAEGLGLVLARELPEILCEHLAGALQRFLHANGRSLGDVGVHLVHPGGRRILAGYAETLGLTASDLRHSYEALRRYGNLSSVSILTVLELALCEGGLLDGSGSGTALALGVGPGLSLEILLLSEGTR